MYSGLLRLAAQEQSKPAKTSSGRNANCKFISHKQGTSKHTLLIISAENPAARTFLQIFPIPEPSENHTKFDKRQFTP